MRFPKIIIVLAPFLLTGFVFSLWVAFRDGPPPDLPTPPAAPVAKPLEMKSDPPIKIVPTVKAKPLTIEDFDPKIVSKAKKLLACKDDPKTRWYETGGTKMYDCVPYGSIDLEGFDDSTIYVAHASEEVCAAVYLIMPAIEGCVPEADDRHPEWLELIKKKYSK